jgi:hypothetical protein
MQAQKGLAPILWIIILAVALGGGYWAYQYTKGGLLCWPYCPGMTDEDREEIKRSALEAQTANWNTYRNEEYGFEFKYPTSAKLYTGGGVIENGVALSVPRTNPSVISKDIDFFALPSFSQCPGRILTGTRIFQGTGVLGGKAFTMERYWDAESAIERERYLGIVNGRCVEVGIGIFWNTKTPSDSTRKDEKAIFDHILSTFKFTK